MSSQLINMISASFVETIIMVLISGGIGAAIGIPLGILLFITDRKSFLPMPKFHFVLSIIINATRSVPFIILLVAIIPFTRLVVGSSIGTAAAIVPLTISVAPFIARMVSLIGYSAMAGVVGGGGLGDLGIRYGYQRFMPEVMWPVVLVLIVLVQGIQSMGDYLVRRLSHK